MLPEILKPYGGRILDVDSHENMPAQVWVETFGEVARPIAEELMAWPPPDKNAANYPGYPGDIREIDPATIWSLKGPSSPGAVDIARRVQVLDVLQIDRQLMFPTSIGMWGSLIHGAPENSPLHARFGASGPGYAARLFAAYNEWAIGAAKVSKRIRPVAPLYGETPQELFAVCERLLASGLRAFLLISSAPPGGVSPAHQDLDRFYSLLEEADAVLTLHIGGQTAFMRTTTWGEAAAFDGYKINEEINMSPWRLSTIHLAPQNFLAAMITGGVFDRHPALRVGALEFGAHWIGPLASLLDLWHDNNQSLGLKTFSDGSESRRLPMRPSEYICRNVRIAPFDFEPVDRYIERYGLEDVYCFASDYPHVEGGKDPMGRLSAAVARLGPGVVEKFFVTNGQLLLPH
jgi:predicted TIM-barrel fold metal-dependent hydrolase